MVRSGNPIYLGWFIVATCFVITMITLGTRFSFGVFMLPMSEEFGWNRGTVSLAASVGFLVNGISQPFIGRIYDRIGGRRLILSSLAVLGAATALLSLTNHIVFLVLIFGVVMAVATSGNSVSTIAALLSKWFRRKRGTAVAIIAAGTSTGGLVLIPFAAYLMEFVGWRTTWLVLGLLLLALAFPLAFIILKNDPRDVGLLPDGDRHPPAGAEHAQTPVARGPLEAEYWLHAFRSSPMWLLCTGYAVCGFTTAMINTHFVPMAVDRGFPSTIAATAFGVMSALNILGALGAGWLGDRFGRKNLLGFVYFLRAGAFGLLLVTPGFWGVWAFAVLAGFSWIATVPLTNALTADVYGLRNIGVLAGIVYAAHQIGGSIGIQLAGVMRDVTGNYDISVIVSLALLIGAGLASLAIQERQYSMKYQAPPPTPASA